MRSTWDIAASRDDAGTQPLDRSAVHKTKTDGVEGGGGGKRAQNKLQNRQAILTAAREVFAEVGYEAASLRDIIGRTGLLRERSLLRQCDRNLVHAHSVFKDQLVESLFEKG
jgi:hypothetical protein